MTLRPLVLLLSLSGMLAAADAPPPILAKEIAGDNVAVGKPLAISEGQEVSTANSVARLNFISPTAGFVLLAPNSSLHLKRITEKDGASLVIAIDSGRIEVSLDKRKPYQDVHVLGGTLDVRVTGTLFVVERLPHDHDYVALIHGKVSVTLRGDIASAVEAGARDNVELDSREGVGGGPSGLSATTDTLGSRPQLTVLSSVQSQGGGKDPGSWNQDSALDSVETGAGPGGEDIGENVGNNIAGEIANEVENEVNNQIGREVVNQTLGGNTPPAFGPPPGPP
jgi:hypothetical protein